MSENLDALRAKIDGIDAEMTRLFEERMKISAEIGRFKEENGLPVSDTAREADVLYRGAERLSSPELRPCFYTFQKTLMTLSKELQQQQRKGTRTPAMTISSASGRYPVFAGNGLSEHAGECFALDRRVLVVTDDGVPADYAERVAGQCGNPVVYTMKQGEKNKTPDTVLALCTQMEQCGFDRCDCVIAVGGGIVCDTAGLAAALYRRGIGFYAIPTTLLAQADASVGGKCGVNWEGIKNLVGTVRAPDGVLIDPLLLSALPARELSCGMAELLKIALCFDRALFDRLSTVGYGEIPPLDDILCAVRLKADVVEADERESGLRRSLNFGHTVGHAIEELTGGRWHHGECVAAGMLPFCSEEVLSRLLTCLDALHLPCVPDVEPERLLPLIRRDKKSENGMIHVIFCDMPGHFSESLMTPEQICHRAADTYARLRN